MATFLLWARRSLWVVLVALLFFAVTVFLKEPRADRDWMPDYDRVATTETSGGEVTIRNVRDWTYSIEGPTSHAWRDVTVDPKTLTRAWFAIEPFSDYSWLAHTFLSFEFDDGETLTFSIEAKKEVGESYALWPALTNEFELIYLWSTERDSLGQVVVGLNRAARLYPLEISSEQARKVFAALLSATNKLAREPRFYNALTENCTNILASIVNDIKPGTLPWSLSWYATGWADTYLMKHGFIRLSSTPGETRKAHELLPHREDLTRMAESDRRAFSGTVRALLPQSL